MWGEGLDAGRSPPSIPRLRIYTPELPSIEPRAFNSYPRSAHICKFHVLLYVPLKDRVFYDLMLSMSPAVPLAKTRFTVIHFTYNKASSPKDLCRISTASFQWY